MNIQRSFEAVKGRSWAVVVVYHWEAALASPGKQSHISRQIWSLFLLFRMDVNACIFKLDFRIIERAYQQLICPCMAIKVFRKSVLGNYILIINDGFSRRPSSGLLVVLFVSPSCLPVRRNLSWITVNQSGCTCSCCHTSTLHFIFT